MLLQVIYVTSLRVSLVKNLDTHSIIIQLLLVQYTTQVDYCDIMMCSYIHHVWYCV